MAGHSATRGSNPLLARRYLPHLARLELSTVEIGGIHQTETQTSMACQPHIAGQHASASFRQIEPDRAADDGRRDLAPLRRGSKSKARMAGLAAQRSAKQIAALRKMMFWPNVAIEMKRRQPTDIVWRLMLKT